MNLSIPPKKKSTVASTCTKKTLVVCQIMKSYSSVVCRNEDIIPRPGNNERTNNVSANALWGIMSAASWDWPQGGKDGVL